MSYLTTKQFWTDTFERTVRTAAQTAAATFGGSAVVTAVTDADWASIPWEASLGLTVLAAALAFLTALAGKAVGDPSTASLTSGTKPKSIGTGGGGPLDSPTTRPTL